MPNYNPRHVYVVSFDTADTDLYYFCSHDDIVISGVSESNIFRGVLISPSTTSQGLDPIRANATIGNISFSFIDSSQTLTALLNTKLTGSPSQGLRAKRVQHWVGEQGAEYPSSYTLLQTQQFYNSIGWANNAYTFNAQDIQRTELQDIFEPKKTTLTASLGLTGNTINVNSSADFSLVQHGGAYSDAPNTSVLYLKIEDEIIRCTAKPTSTSFTIDNEASTLSAAASANDTTLSITNHSAFQSSGYGYVTSGSPAVSYPIKWTGKSDSPHQLTGVTGVTTGFDSGSAIVSLEGRGVLGSRIAEHNVDTNQPADKRTKVEEYIYIEMPAVQLAYAVLTGTIYGSSPASTFPSHWNLGISAANWVATSEFTSIGTDIWDTSDDTAGLILRFEGLKKTNAKKFLEEEILFICGLYTPILETGELGLRRMSGVVSDSAYSRVLNESNILDISNIYYDLDNIHNDFLVRWNYNAISGEYTRDVNLIDSASQNRWGTSKQLEITSLGLKGSIHTDSIIGNLFNTWRDRHAGPPFKATVQLAYSERDIRIGDIVRLKISNIPEFTDQNSVYGSLDISVEVQRLSINYQTGVVTIDVFGSTNRAGPLVIGNPALDDTFYTSQGSDISGVGTVTGSAAGGTFTITANSSLTGVTDLNSATATTDNDQGIFYYDGNITINSGITLTITNNVEIRCKGILTNNGTINGAGQGLSGGATGTAGYIGTTRSSGGIFYSIFQNGQRNITSVGPTVTDILIGALPSECEWVTTTGQNTTVGPFNIINNDTSIAGKPGDLRGTSGGKGGDCYQLYAVASSATGGNGGAGGAGLLVICRGAIGGANSNIDLSGSDGTAGATTDSARLVSGTGAGGYPGGLVIVLDGNTVTETISPYFTANIGDSTVRGYQPPDPGYYSNAYSVLSTPIYSYYDGFQTESKSISNLYVHYLTESQTAAVDTPSQSTLPTAIGVAEHAATQNAINIYGLELSATAPSDTNYKAARIYIKKQSTEGWHLVGDAASGQEVIFWVPADGSTYDIKAHSISITNIESTDYIERTYTVQSNIQTQIGTGSTLVSGANVTTNGGLLVSGSNLLVYDSSGNITQSFDLSGTGNFTGIGTTSGSAADEQLVPNNFFDFNTDGWYQEYGTTSSPLQYYTTMDSPNVEGNYLLLTDGGATYEVVSKTFKLIPNKKYRVRLRVAHNGTGTIDGLGVGIGYRNAVAGFIEPLTIDNRSDFVSIVLSATSNWTSSFATYEYDFTCSATAYWGSLYLYYNTTVANESFKIAWVEVLPWGILSDTDIGVFINDTTFGNQGIQLDYNGGTPRAYVGNGDKKYLKFDGTDLSVGEDGGLLGAATYPDDTTFYNIPNWISTDGLNKVEVTGGTVNLLPSSGTLRCSITGTSGSSATAVMEAAYTFTGYTWTESRKFKTVPYWASISSTTTIYIITGATSNGFGFKYTSGTWYAWNRWSPSETTSSITVSSTNTLEAILDRTTSPHEIRFYVSGSLVATHTTNLPPTGSGIGFEQILLMAITQNSTDTTRHIEIGEFKALVGF